MARIEDFHIEFFQKWAVYKAGDIVSGRVHLRLNDSVYCDEIKVQCYGSARVFWVERELKPPHGFRSVPYNAERVFFDLKDTVWESTALDKKDEKIRREESIDKILDQAKALKLREPIDPSRPQLKPGTLQQFGFSFELPTGKIPTSFDASHADGCIRYYIRVCLLDQGRIKHSRKEYFTIVDPLDLRHIPAAGQSAFDIVNAHFSRRNTILCCLPGTGGTISLSVTLQKVGYVPGERIELSAEIENQTLDRSVVRLRARLMQQVLCYSHQPEVKTRESTKAVTTVGLARKVGPGQSWLWDQQSSIFVPAVTPSLAESCLLEVSYFILVELFLIKEAPCVAAKIPILIGTVPVREWDRKAPPSYPTTHKVSSSDQESDPPHYEDVPFDAPPTYEESILGASAVEETDFRPRYAVFHDLTQPLLS